MRSARFGSIEPNSARIAQLVEHFHGKEGVVGSSPIPGFARLFGAVLGQREGDLLQAAFAAKTLAASVAIGV